MQTYGEPAVTIKPGPRLNLVLGPNGKLLPLDCTALAVSTCSSCS